MTEFESLLPAAPTREERSHAPEDHAVFRLAQLAVLLDEIAPVGGRGVDLERLAYYDFFAANPFAIVRVEDSADRARLHRAGFDERQLAYASTGSRFANRRKRLQHDVALLVAYRLVERRGDGYGSTSRGADFVAAMAALYVDQYRSSVQVVHGRMKNLSDAQLSRSARGWLRTPSLVLDLYGSTDDLVQAEASQSSEDGG